MMPRDTELLVGAWDPSGQPGRLTRLDIRNRRAARSEAAPSSALAIATGASGEVVYTAEADGVAAWRRSANGLTPLGPRHASPGTLPCHLAVVGDHVVVAHYEGGQVTVHPLGADGALEPPSDVVQLEGSGPDPERQAGPHPHMVWSGPGDEVIVVDLGADLLRRFRLESGTLVPTVDIPVPPGTGPRHLVVLDGLAYVAGELADTLVLIRLSSGEVLHVLPCGMPPAERAMPSYPSAIKLSDDGRYCYVLRRGPDTVSTFELGPTPRLVGESACGGDWPWDLVVAGEQLFVANQRSGTLSRLRVGADGVPTATGDVFVVPDAVSLLHIDPERPVSHA